MRMNFIWLLMVGVIMYSCVDIVKTDEGRWCDEYKPGLSAAECANFMGY